MDEVFLLMADFAGTTRSMDQSTGVAVTTEAEAKRFVYHGTVGFSRSYEKIKIFTNMEDARGAIK